MKNSDLCSIHLCHGSWGSGANPWGPEKEDAFSKPNHWDGMLEVVGVTGVVHLGQIQSGLRSAMRIAQVIIMTCCFIFVIFTLVYCGLNLGREFSYF
jgi:hypothetical protein